jgi:AraC-like DNA-binding protein
MKVELGSTVMGNLLEILPVLMTREFEYAPVLEDPQRKRLAQLWDEVRLKPANKWNVDLCAQKIFVSKGHLHQLTQKYYNCRPMEKVTNIRILCSEEILLSSDKSLELIAQEVGYGSATAFSNAFFKAKGMRPGDYRNKSLLR